MEQVKQVIVSNTRFAGRELDEREVLKLEFVSECLARHQAQFFANVSTKPDINLFCKILSFLNIKPM
jgi:hypothetical protein